jgi:hypothetical protein
MQRKTINPPDLTPDRAAKHSLWNLYIVLETLNVVSGKYSDVIGGMTTVDQDEAFFQRFFPNQNGLKE